MDMKMVFQRKDLNQYTKYYSKRNLENVLIIQ